MLTCAVKGFTCWRRSPLERPGVNGKGPNTDPSVAHANTTPTLSEEALRHYFTGGKEPVTSCICENMGNCVWCYEDKGLKRPKTETDSNWDPTSPSKYSTLDAVATPQSGTSTHVESPEVREVAPPLTVTLRSLTVS